MVTSGNRASKRRELRRARGRTCFSDTARAIWYRDSVFPARSGWSANPIACFQAQRVDPHRTSRLALLQRNDITRELCLSAEQQTDILNSFVAAQRECDEAVRAVERGRTRGRPSHLATGQEAPPDWVMEVRAIRRTHNQRMYETLDVVLTPDQAKRLDELDLRYRGALALVDEKVAVRIGLSEEARARAARGYSQYLAALAGVQHGIQFRRALFVHSGGISAARVAAIAEAYDAAAAACRAAVGAELLEGLSPQQRARWDEVLGEPFPFQSRAAMNEGMSELKGAPHGCDGPAFSLASRPGGSCASFRCWVRPRSDGAAFTNQRTYFALRLSPVTGDVGLCAFPSLSMWSSDPVVRFLAQRIDPRRNSTLAILQRDDVVTDIGLTVEQASRLQTRFAAVKQCYDRTVTSIMTAAVTTPADGPAESGLPVPNAPEPAATARRLANERMYSAVDEVLTPRQAMRVNQIDLQYRGLLALADPKVAARLGLSQEQEIRVARVYARYLVSLGAAWRCLFTSAAIIRAMSTCSWIVPDRHPALLCAYETAATNCKHRLGAEVFPLLTPEQRRNWDGLVGPPAAFDTSNVSLTAVEDLAAAGERLAPLDAVANPESPEDLEPPFDSDREVRGACPRQIRQTSWRHRVARMALPLYFILGGFGLCIRFVRQVNGGGAQGRPPSDVAGLDEGLTRSRAMDPAAVRESGIPQQPLRGLRLAASTVVVGPGTDPVLDPTRNASLALLERDDVVSELGISYSQRRDIADGVATLRQEWDGRVRAITRAGSGGAHGPSQARSSAVRSQVHAAIRRSEEAMLSIVERTLSDPQWRRLCQIDLQLRGGLALVDEPVARRVGIRRDQAMHVIGAIREYGETVQSVGRRLLARGEPPDAGARRLLSPSDSSAWTERLRSVTAPYREDFGQKALTYLTPEQRRVWDGMLGPRFEFAPR